MLKICIEELPEFIRLARKAKFNILVVSDPGVGKSQVIEGMVDSHTRLETMTGSSTIEEYVNGIPQVNDDGVKQLEYVPSEWLVRMYLYGKEHPDDTQILFLDEFNTADPQVLKTFLTILSERRVPTCGIDIPDNTVIVAAMNPQDQNEGEPLIRPLVSRFLVLNVSSTPDQFCNYLSGVENNLTRCDLELQDEAVPLSVDVKVAFVKKVSGNDWGKFEDGDYHEINPRSFDAFFRALSWCKKPKECAPLLSQGFLGAKLSFPQPKKNENKSGGGVAIGGFLDAEQLKQLSDDELHEYAALIFRENLESDEAKWARLRLMAELDSRGVEVNVGEEIDRGNNYA